MKKILFLFIAFLFMLSGCRDKSTFTLKGTISGLPSDTILVFYQEPHYHLDTIIAEKGKFNYTISPDTFTIFSLIFNEHDLLPVYADRGQEVVLEGELPNLQIKGEGENSRMNAIRQKLKSLEGNRTALMTAVDSLIKENPYSYTNLYLIDQFYVQDSLVNYKRILELVKGLSGNIKDTPYMIGLQAKLEEYTERENNRAVSNLFCTDKNGKVVDWNVLRNKYVLLDFWAGWNKESVTAQDSLVPVLKALKKEKFIVVSVSLDLDKQEWLAASKRDTTQWRQVCDFKGWDNHIVKQQGVTRIPTNILISPDQKIIARDIRGKELIDKMKQLLQQDKEREKAEKARQRQNRR